MMRFAPATSGIVLDGEPEVTGVPLTVTLAFVSDKVGVTVMSVALLTTVAVYDSVPGANAGFSELAPNTRLLKSALPFRLERVTDMLYVLVVVSSAVITTLIGFGPRESGIAPDCVPDVTGAPFTMMCAVRSATVGVTLMLATLCATVAEYAVVPGANAGESVPLLKARLLKSALLDLARVTVTT